MWQFPGQLVACILSTEIYHHKYEPLSVATALMATEFFTRWFRQSSAEGDATSPATYTNSPLSSTAAIFRRFPSSWRAWARISGHKPFESPCELPDHPPAADRGG